MTTVHHLLIKELITDEMHSTHLENTTMAVLKSKENSSKPDKANFEILLRHSK